MERLRALWEEMNRFVLLDINPQVSGSFSCHRVAGSQLVTRDLSTFTQEQRTSFENSRREVVELPKYLEAIFSHLDPASIKNVRLVCRLVFLTS